MNHPCLFMNFQEISDRSACRLTLWRSKSSWASFQPEDGPRASSRRTTKLGIPLVILACVIGHAQAQTAWDVLAEADRLAWLKNWSRAEPLFSKAEQLFAAAGDERSALYARVSAL